MKAIVYRGFGSPDLLRLEDVEKPAPREDEVLIRVRAASVNPLDWYFLRGTPRLVRLGSAARKAEGARPGVDVAGVVEAAGTGVTDMKQGDEVFGTCRGAFAEYVCTSPAKLTIKPPSVPFEQAAATPIAGVTALQGLRDTARLRDGQKVLINGAAGGVGTFAVQIAKSIGAAVTGVCSTRNLDLVRSIGADATVDYTKNDFTRSGRRWDVIFDCITNRSVSDIRRALEPHGSWIIAGGLGRHEILRPLARVISARLISKFTNQTMTTFLAKSNKSDLISLGDLMESGRVEPVIDRRYALGEAADAIRYMAEGHARGKVVISISSERK